MMDHDALMALVQERDTLLNDHDSDDPERRDTELIRLDREIKALCPHDSISWDSRSTDDGRIITTCERCEVSWHEHAG
jgi:hypothetical protein